MSLGQPPTYSHGDWCVTQAPTRPHTGLRGPQGWLGDGSMGRSSVASGSRHGSESMWPRSARSHPENMVNMQPLCLEKDPQPPLRHGALPNPGAALSATGLQCAPTHESFSLCEPTIWDYSSFGVRCTLTLRTIEFSPR